VNIVRKLFAGLFAVSLLVFVPHAHAEEIKNFSALYSIQKDGTVNVQERIQYDFGTALKHGIYRTTPLVKTNEDNKKFRMTVSDVRVTDEKFAAYTVADSSTEDELNLRIGDADRTISGIHMYTIQYTVSGALTYYSDHDEFYWNVTGNGWVVPITRSSGTVQFPETIPESDIKMKCFTGQQGSTQSQCGSVYLTGAATMASSSQLGVSDGLTIVVSFPKNIVEVLEPSPVIEKVMSAREQLIAAIISVIMIVAGFLWYIGLPLFIIIRWYRVGRDPKPTVGVATAWFEPPKTKSGRLLTPGETGTLIDEEAGMKEITATIVDLARRGYMKIVEVKKKEFVLNKLKAYSDDKTLEKHERELLSGLFEKGDTLKVKGADLASTVTTVKSSLYTAVVTEGFFDKNPNTTRTIFYVIAGVGLFTGNILLAVVSFLFGRAMPRKTLAGADAAAVATSLKNFLSSQERWLAGMAKDQGMFEKLLPYAIAFGVEKIWARRFADIAMTDPSWYQGYGAHTFTSMYMVNALASTSRSFVSAATPTRSSSGFSSGFSGGGFSGGGGGGGGGGSW
jgi:uncharacterized membrane protein